MKREIVLIEWADSKGLQRWEELDEIEPMPPETCIAVGFLLDDAPEYKTIALSVGITQVLGRTTIPIGAIKRIKRLRY